MYLVSFLFNANFIRNIPGEIELRGNLEKIPRGPISNLPNTPRLRLGVFGRFEIGPRGICTKSLPSSFSPVVFATKSHKVESKSEWYSASTLWYSDSTEGDFSKSNRGTDFLSDLNRLIKYIYQCNFFQICKLELYKVCHNTFPKV